MKGQAAGTTSEFIASGHSPHIQVYCIIHRALNLTAANVSPATGSTTVDISADATATNAKALTATSFTEDVTGSQQPMYPQMQSPTHEQMQLPVQLQTSYKHFVGSFRLTLKKGAKIKSDHMRRRRLV